ncbi:hypothetical protein [Brevundimonas sp. Root1279]|uniref:hypothetical protein n=1 Tax=Brevundimonas sp. Root1279 TaxID=1736443 RepID=UPI0006F4F4DD|nr:hypothetical protein [Brevundimonas sp. Root1279]KQW79704.1 hypothetical protein ASC65_14240 [Brevundimonas sp. Root1279]
MQPQRRDLAGWSNVPLPRDVITILVNKVPLNLTGCTARMQVRTSDGTKVSDITGPSASGIEFVNDAAGQIIPHVEWPDMMSAWSAASPKAGADAVLSYDLVITDADDLEQARLEGAFTVKAGTTVPGGYALAEPPFGDDAGDFSTMVPNTAQPVVAMRTPDNALVVRCLTDTGILEEFTVKDPAGYQGVAGGYQRVAHRAFVGGRVYEWLIQPEADGSRSIEEGAIRIHDAAYTYSTGSDSTGGAFGGYGHGHWLNTPTDNQITMTDGPAGNLQSFLAWPAGTVIRGTALVLRVPMRQVFYGTSTEAVSVIIDSVIDSQGMSTQLTMQALRSDVKWQDSYVPMFAATCNGQVNRAKLAGYTAITLVGETVPANQQKGNWNAVAGLPIMQFYLDTDDTVICEDRVTLGPPMRKNGVDLNWDLNMYGRVHVTDVAGSGGNPNYAKFRVFINSSEQIPPRTSWAMDPADVYTSVNRRRTVIRPGGPL